MGDFLICGKILCVSKAFVRFRPAVSRGRLSPLWDARGNDRKLPACARLPEFLQTTAEVRAGSARFCPIGGCGHIGFSERGRRHAETNCYGAGGYDGRRCSGNGHFDRRTAGGNGILAEYRIGNHRRTEPESRFASLWHSMRAMNRSSCWAA